MTKLGWSGGPLPSSHRNWLSYRTGNQHTLILRVIRDPRAQMSAKSMVLLVGSDPATNTTERAYLVCGKPHCVAPSLTTSHAPSRWHVYCGLTRDSSCKEPQPLWSHCANRYEKTHSFTRGLAQSDFSESLSNAPQCLPMSLLRQFIYYGKMHTPQNVLSTFKGAFGDMNYTHPS